MRDDRPANGSSIQQQQQRLSQVSSVQDTKISDLTHHWFKTPSFDLQGKALLDKQLLKKYNLETL